MFEEERLLKIAEYVQNRTRATVPELCNVFRISESTVRRDLTELDSRKLLKRTHGGAISVESVSSEPSYSEKEDTYRAEKESIAKKAAEFIEDGDTLIVDSGTTTLCLISELARFKNLTIVTNSIILAAKIPAQPDTTVLLTGGVLRNNTLALVGPTAESTLSNLHADKAFIGTNGIDASYGFSTPNVIEASVKRKMIDAADQVYILADHSKFGRISFAKFGDISCASACITGNDIDEKQLEMFRRKDFKVYTVS